MDTRAVICKPFLQSTHTVQKHHTYVFLAVWLLVVLLLLRL
jgi:hypothetical protein